MVDLQKTVNLVKSTFGFMRGNMRVIVVTRLIRWFSTRTTSAYFPLYIIALDGTATSIGIINALRSLARLLLYPVGGYISDYKGRVKLISTVTYLSAFTYLFYILAPEWRVLAIGVFLQGLILFSTPAMEALMADSLPPEQRGMGFSSIQGLSYTVGIFAPYIGGYLITIYGINHAMRWLYTLVFISGIVAATLYLRFLKETLKRPESGIPLKKLSLLLKTSYKSLWETLRWMPESLKSLVFISALSAIFTSIAQAFWIIYAVEVIKITALEWGIITLVMGVFRALLSIPAGQIIDRYGRKKTIVAALALSIPPALLFPYCNSFLQTLAVLIFISIANVFLLPATSALAADIVPRERRGRVMAAFGQHMLMVPVGSGPPMGFVLSIFTTLGALAGGYIYSFNPLYPWFLLSAAITACLILSILFIREPEKAEF